MKMPMLILLAQLFVASASASTVSCSYVTDENTPLLEMAVKSARLFGVDIKDIKGEFRRILEDEKKLKVPSFLSSAYLFNCDTDSEGYNYSAMRQALVDYILTPLKFSKEVEISRS